MCLITDQKRRVAQEDIKCWKALREDMKSPHEKFQYEKGKRYRTLIEKDESEWLTCHDFGDERYLSEHWPEWRDRGHKELKYFGRGFHVYTSFKRAEAATDHTGEELFEAIIPKGAYYYEGFTDLAVTSQIIIL